MAYVVMVYIVMAYIVIAYIVMAYIVMAYIVMAYMVIAFVVMAHRETLDSFVALGIRLHVCCMCDAFTLHIDVACLTFFQIKGVNDVYATSPPQICTCGLATCLCQLLVTCICQLWMLSADSHVPLPALLCQHIAWVAFISTRLYLQISLCGDPEHTRQSFFRQLQRDPNLQDVDIFFCSTPMSYCELFMPFNKTILAVNCWRIEYAPFHRMVALVSASD